MKISTRARYGLRAMLELALNFGVRPVRLDDIAKEQNLSPKYLHFLLSSLKSAGLIHCIRGRSGGYVLTRNPDKINMRDVLVALEGPVVFAECVPEPQLCADSRGCVTRAFWGNLGAAIENYLSEITLGQMARDHVRNMARTQPVEAAPMQEGCQKSRDNMVNIFNSRGEQRKFLEQF